MAIVSTGWLTLDGKDRLKVTLSDRGKLSFSGDGPSDWANVVLEEYGDFMVYANGGSTHLLPVTPATFPDFLNKVATLAWRNLEVDWKWRVEEGDVRPDIGSPSNLEGEIPDRSGWY